MPYAEEEMPLLWIIQDNNSKHESNNFLFENNVPVFKSPSQSPDLSPNENMFRHLKRKLWKQGRIMGCYSDFEK